MHFFSDFCVSSVLESSCTRMYTAVLRAVLSCTHIKITIFRGTLLQKLKSQTGEQVVHLILTTHHFSLFDSRYYRTMGLPGHTFLLLFLT